jgi:signal peptidase I
MFGLRLFKVKGCSMEPEYRENDILVGIRLPLFSIQPGENVIINHPYYKVIVKKVMVVLPSGDINVCGVNPNSTPSKALGVIQRDWIRGKVVMRIPECIN